MSKMKLKVTTKKIMTIPWFIEFWKRWDRLVELYQNEDQLDDDYLKDFAYWPNCKRKSKIDEYSRTLFGVEIDYDLKKRDSKRIQKAGENYLGKLVKKEEITRILEWSIWNEIVDLQINLQWIEWSKNFCFNCLILWILTVTTWPNWRVELTKSKI